MRQANASLTTNQNKTEKGRQMMMHIQRFDTSMGYERINRLLSQSIRIQSVRLRGGTYFIQYEDAMDKKTKNNVLFHTQNEAGSMERVIAVLQKRANATNIHWDVDIDRVKRWTISIIFWEEPIGNLPVSDESGQ